MAGRVGRAAMGCLQPVISVLGLVLLIAVGWGLWSLVGHVYYLVDGREADAALYASKANVALSSGESLSDLQVQLGPPTSHGRTPNIVNSTDYCWFRDCKIKAQVLDGGSLVSLLVDGPGLYGDPVFQGTFDGLKIGGPAPAPGKEGGASPGFFWRADNGRITMMRFSVEVIETRVH